MLSEPTIQIPAEAPRKIGEASLPGARAGRYAPKRGLVRRIRNARANDSLRSLAERHLLDPEARERLSAELIKAGAPPVTREAAQHALSRIVTFDPLNADALRPFLVIGTDRNDRAMAVAKIADAMRKAGRSVRLFSDALDAEDNVHLQAAAERHRCGLRIYDGPSECVEMLRRTDLASLSIIEAGLRPPLDRVALQRLNKLCQATGAEPIAVIRPAEALQTLGLARIGVRRMILVETGEPVRLGPALSAARRGNLAFAELMSSYDLDAPLRAATAGSLAEMLAAE